MSEVQSAAPEYGPEMFANNFWGKDESGYDVLTERLKQAKRTCEEIRAVYHERALIEEEYAKRLSKLSKFPLGKDETGTLREALEVTKLELEENAKEHMNLSHKMRTELEQDLSDFMTKQKEKRKSQQMIAERSLRNKQGQAALMQKAKEKYESECVKITGLLSSKTTVIGKELEKMVKTLADATEKWNYDWRVSCDKFQDLEEERIEFLKRSLWNYANFVSTVCVADDESCERIRVSLENCDEHKDILIFIRERATGPEIPEPPTYVNFYADSKENGARFKKASFSKFLTQPARQIEELDQESSQSITPSQQPPANNGIRYPQSTHALYNYLPEENISFYNRERASLYANTSTASPASTIKLPPPKVIDDEKIEEEPIDPNKPQMLSIGSNVLEVQTNVDNTGNVGSTENIDKVVEKAFANMSKLDEKTEKRGETVTSPEMLEQTTKVTRDLRSDSERPESYHLDKPQPVIPGEQSSQQKDPPDNPNPVLSTDSKSEPLQEKPGRQENVQSTESKSVPVQKTSQISSSSPSIFQQRLTRQRSVSSSNYSSYQQLSATPSVVSSTQSLKPQPVEGPGDLRRQSSTDYGPVSSQQQQIEENLAMRPSPSSLKIPTLQQGPGDLRRVPSNCSEHSLRRSQQMSAQYNSPTVAERQMEVLSQRRSSSPNLQQGSPSNTNRSIGINLDIHGRVVQDVLAETFVANDGRLPPIQQQQYLQQPTETFVVNDERLPPINLTLQQQYPQQPGKQVYSNYIPLQNNPVNHPTTQARPTASLGRLPPTGGYGAVPTNATPQSSLRGGQTIPSHQVSRSNTIISNNFAQPNPYLNQNTFDPQQNRRSTLPGSIGYPRPDYQNPKFYATPRGPPTEYRQRMPTRPQIQRTDDGKQILFYVKALYDYSATQPDEMSFTANDIIAVLDTSPDGWWQGSILDHTRRERGTFPCNYTEVLNDWIS